MLPPTRLWPISQAGLIDCWPLVEQSGTRFSLTGRNDLTDVATVTGAAGLFGYASQFTRANSEFLSHVNNVDLVLGDFDFFYLIWSRADSAGAGDRHLLSKRAVGSVECTLVRGSNTNNILWGVTPDGATLASVTDIGTYTANEWHLTMAWHDAANNFIGLRVDRNPPVTLAHSSGVFVGTSDFDIGATSTGGNTYDGRMVDASFWKRLLSEQEYMAIYNNGLGRRLVG